MKKMNLPNKLTILRVLLVPVYAVLMYLSYELKVNVTDSGVYIISPEYNRLIYIAGVVFILASLTDLVDGKIARKYDMVTDFGKFADPIADKILVLTAVIILSDLGRIPSWCTIVIVSREIIIAALRNIAVLKNRVVAADIYGKIKTMTQLISVSAMHFETILPFLSIPIDIIFYLSMFFTVLSGVNYMIKNADVFKDVA